MNGSSIAPLASGAAEYGTLGTLTVNAAAVKQKLDTLSEQASTGLLAQSYAGLGNGAATSLALTPAIAAQNTYSANINAATGNMQVAQTALSQISDIASTFYADISDLNGLDPSEITSVAANAQAALVQVANLLDSTDGDTYVFAGQDSSNPPVPNPDAILSTGFYTQISALVGAVNSNGAAATIGGIVSVAASNAAGTSPFSTALSQPAANVASLVPTIQVGTGQAVPVGILASANAAVASETQGNLSTGSYMRDIMGALATLGAMTSTQANTTGLQGLASDTYTILGNAITALNQDAGVLGNTQSQLNTTQTNIGNVTTALQSQLSGAQDADLASTLSQLSLVQTQLQSSYRMISTVSSLALTTYLPTPA